MHMESLFTIMWHKVKLFFVLQLKLLTKKNSLFNSLIDILKTCKGNLNYYLAVSLRTTMFNPLNPELNPICYLLALLAHHFLHVSRIRVKSLTIRLLMSYIYGAPILNVSRSHTTTQHSR